MKKRRELDALVSKTLSRSIGKTKNGNHELLRNDSYSSEGEDFVLPEKDAISTKKPKPNFCLMCMLIFSTIMLLSCFGIMGSLLWMFIQLKSEVQDLRLQISKVESSTSEKVKEYLKDVQTDLHSKSLEMKNEELSKSTINILLLQDHVAVLKNVTNSLNSSLVKTMKDLDKTSADGKQLFETLKVEVIELKKNEIENKESINKLHGVLHDINLKILESPKDVKSQIQEDLKNVTELLNSKVLILETKIMNEVTGKTLEEKLNETISFVKELNTSQWSFVDRMTLLETKLVSLAQQQRDLNEVPHDVIKKVSMTTPGKDFVGAASEVIPTSSDSHGSTTRVTSRDNESFHTTRYASINN